MSLTSKIEYGIDPDALKAGFDERMRIRREREEREESERAESARQAYLKRTGRTEMKP